MKIAFIVLAIVASAALLLLFGAYKVSTFKYCRYKPDKTPREFFQDENPIDKP